MTKKDRKHLAIHLSAIKEALMLVGVDASIEVARTAQESLEKIEREFPLLAKEIDNCMPMEMSNENP